MQYLGGKLNNVYGLGYKHINLGLGKPAESSAPPNPALS